MDDNRGVMFAACLFFFWVAGVAFFTAFHPGGLTTDGAAPEADGSNAAKNPVDVLKFLMIRGGEGASTSADVQTT